MTMKLAIQIGVLAVFASTLGACTGSTSDLQTWMEQERASVTPVRFEVKPPSEFVPYAYNGTGLVSPFSSSKLLMALAGEGAKAELPPEEQDRETGTLERFPIESITMVGSMSHEKTGEAVALLQVENFVYQIKVGEHLGLNKGRVLRITETAIDIRELVPSGHGEWIERPVTLHLQEGQSS